MILYFSYFIVVMLFIMWILCKIAGAGVSCSFNLVVILYCIGSWLRGVCVCVCACVCVCVWCVRACVHACVRACVHACVRACVSSHSSIYFMISGYFQCFCLWLASPELTIIISESIFMHSSRRLDGFACQFSL